jgi:hypothetical protein
VLPTRDTRTRYDSRPLSTGPYRISAETGRSLLLVPNLEWSSTTDPLREDQEARVLVVFGDPASSMDRP